MVAKKQQQNTLVTLTVYSNVGKENKLSKRCIDFQLVKLNVICMCFFSFMQQLKCGITKNASIIVRY